MTSSHSSRTSRALIWLLLAVVMLVSAAWLMVHLHQVQNWDGGLMMFDHDLSDSMIGWMIAIPILIIVAIVTVAILFGVAILVAGIVAMAVVIALIATVFGLIMAVLPLAVLLAVPVLIVVGIVKLVSPKAQYRHQPI